MPRLIILLWLLLLTSCRDNNIHRTDSAVSIAKAVYFVDAQGGGIAAGDLEQHPEIKVVHQFSGLKEGLEEGMAIWIDKNSAGDIDLNWLKESPQNMKPIVLVGYHDALYAFREILDAFGISGPQVGFSMADVESGFSVWKWKETAGAENSAWSLGYDELPTVVNIAAVTDPLLAGLEPPGMTAPFDEQKAVEAVLADHPEYPQAGEFAFIHCRWKRFVFRHLQYNSFAEYVDPTVVRSKGHDVVNEIYNIIVLEEILFYIGIRS